MSEGTTGATVQETSGRSGWMIFAAVMLIIGGAVYALYGLVAVFNNQWVVWTEEGALFVNLSTWGWIHIIIGLLVLLCGLGLFTGSQVARVFGVVIAAVSLIANFFFIPVAPFWALTVIVIDVLIIWAITTHADDMQPTR